MELNIVERDAEVILDVLANNVRVLAKVIDNSQDSLHSLTAACVAHAEFQGALNDARAAFAASTAR
jgi:hypothetical protein